MGILKDQLQNSTLGLKGQTPAKRAGASADTTNVHVKGTKQTANHSNLDLDGTIPSQYIDNKPE